MLDFLNIEKQVSKRVRNFLHQQALENKIAEGDARLVINLIIGKAAVHLYNGNNFLKTLEPQNIADFFGKTYDTVAETAIYTYFQDLSILYAVDPGQLYILVYQSSDSVNAHLYQEAKHIIKLPILDIINHFYSQN